MINFDLFYSHGKSTETQPVKMKLCDLMQVIRVMLSVGGDKTQTANNNAEPCEKFEKYYFSSNQRSNYSLNWADWIETYANITHLMDSDRLNNNRVNAMTWFKQCVTDYWRGVWNWKDASNLKKIFILCLVIDRPGAQTQNKVRNFCLPSEIKKWKRREGILHHN